MCYRMCYSTCENMLLRCCSFLPVFFVCTGVRPEQVDILVTNCSIFSATPSLASMLINKFKFRTDVQSYHLVRLWPMYCRTLVHLPRSTATCGSHHSSA